MLADLGLRLDVVLHGDVAKRARYREDAFHTQCVAVLDEAGSQALHARALSRVCGLVVQRQRTRCTDGRSYGRSFLITKTAGKRLSSKQAQR